VNKAAAGTYNAPMGLIRWLRQPGPAGASALRALAPLGVPACAAAAMLLVAAGHAADDFPPPIAPESAQGAAAAGRAPAPAGEAARPPQAESAAPAEAPPKPERDVRIEQKRVGRRVAEIIVTPAGFTYHYTMTHLDDQDPRSLLQPHTELSVPRFFRIDF
jgi:hypothetical protein